MVGVLQNLHSDCTGAAGDLGVTALGAMSFVVVEEVIPEAQQSGNTDLATMATMTGFVVMLLDVALG